MLYIRLCVRGKFSNMPTMNLDPKTVVGKRRHDDWITLAQADDIQRHGKVIKTRHPKPSHKHDVNRPKTNNPKEKLFPSMNKDKKKKKARTFIGKDEQCRKPKSKRKIKHDKTQKTEMRLADGAVIQKENDCYLIVKKLGKGAFAAVYEAKRASDRANVAVKVEFFQRQKEHRIPQECQVYNEIEARRLLNSSDKNITHFLHFYDHLQNKLAEFLILQRAGESIESICTHNDPTLNTAVQWANQALEALEHLHLLGCIHRDIKTANFIISEDKRTLYIIDFGMAVKFIRDPKKMPRTSVYEFIGTAKYASRTAHNGMPQARRDDVESWLYLSMEFFKYDILPWRSCASDKICRRKKQFIEGTAYCEVFNHLPCGYLAMVGVVRETTVMEEPNYDFFYATLKWIAEEKHLDIKKPFEWNFVGRRDSTKEEKSPNDQPPAVNAQKEKNVIESALNRSREQGEPNFPLAKSIRKSAPSK